MAQTTPVTFVDLMAIGAIGKDKDMYVSKRPSFDSLGNGVGYGGHVYAQSAWAASQTVDTGMVVHNIHGFFTLPGLVDRPYIYSITHLSEGRSFCTRSVVVRQPTTPSQSPSFGVFDGRDGEKDLGKICFTCICSFKRDEPSVYSHQADVNLEETYGSALRGGDPFSHPMHPQVDTPWYLEIAARHKLVADFPGLDMRRVDMASFNQSKPPGDGRHLTYYRPIGGLPAKDFNLHASAHIYASDRNSVFIVSNALGFGNEISAMASLSHSVVLHVASEDLLLTDGKWWCQESWTPRSEGGRGMLQSRLWDAKGTHIASTWQDGLARVGSDHKARLAWAASMERTGRLGKEELKTLWKTKL